MAFTLEPCCIRPCSATIGVVIGKDERLARIAADGYSGLTDDGEAVCRDHFCPVCRGAHAAEEQFEACAFYGPDATECDIALLVAR